MTTDQILLGAGLTLVLVVGSQVFAAQLRIPALIVLLPVGFVTGAISDDVNPTKLLGPAFDPLVSLAVAVVLYDAGLGLDLRPLRGRRPRVVVRLIGLGVPVTWAIGTFTAGPLLGMSHNAALLLGAILVVSGPTVVGPLLNYVRPVERIQRILVTEGALIDPVGGILGAVVFTAITAGAHRSAGRRLIEFLSALGIGAVGGLVGIALLWLVLRKLQLGEVLSATAQLAAVVAVAAGCDVIRDDTGLVAAIVMGAVVANRPGYDLPARRPFLETLIELILGFLFFSISTTVTPSSLRGLVLPTLGLAAVLVLAARPLVALISTVRTELSRGERGFVGWMAPRGIVAAATASSFGATLTDQGVVGAAKILPATFLVIVMTVTLYGLTAAPVARRLHVSRPARSRPLLVGGAPWVIELGEALRSAGLDVLMWAAKEQQRQAIRRAGLELAPGRLLADATGRGAALEGITTVLLLTEEDDFNALASTVLKVGFDGPVYRLAPVEPAHGVVAPYVGTEVLFPNGPSGAALAQRHQKGAAIVTVKGDRPLPAGAEPLFAIDPEGRLCPSTPTNRLTPGDQDTVILFSPAAVEAATPARDASVRGRSTS